MESFQRDKEEKGEMDRLLSCLLRDLEAQILTLRDDNVIGHLPVKGRGHDLAVTSFA